MKYFILCLIISVSIIFSSCSGGNNEVNNKGYQPNDPDNIVPQPRVQEKDSIKIRPQPSDVPFEEEQKNPDIKWI
jgi:hypothetical protein